MGLVEGTIGSGNPKTLEQTMGISIYILCIHVYLYVVYTLTCLKQPWASQLPFPTNPVISGHIEIAYPLLYQGVEERYQLIY